MANAPTPDGAPNLSTPDAAPRVAPGVDRRVAIASVALLLTINLFNYIDRYILAAVEPLVRDEFFPDPTQAADSKGKMGLLATAFMVSYMVAAPFFGWLSDRVRRWAIVGIGVMVWSLASGGSGLATTFGILLLTRCFVGIGEAAYGPTAPTIIADLYPVARRGAVLSWFYVAIPVGSALGYTFGGQIAQHLDWRWAFYLVVPPGLLLGVWCFFFREPPRGGMDGGAKHQHARWRDYLVLFKTPSYVYNLAGMTLMTFAVGGLSFWTPTYIHEFRGYTAGLTDPKAALAHVNLVFGGITVVTGLSATLLGGWIADRLRTRFTGSYFLVSGIGMIIGFPLFLVFLASPFPTAWGAMFFAIFFLFLNTGPSNAIIANVTHPSIRATGYAVSIFTIHALGDAISPPLIGWISDRFRSAEHPQGNMNAGFYAVAGAFVLSAVFWLLGSKHLARDTERASKALG